jgi:hypothetical protein
MRIHTHKGTNGRLFSILTKTKEYRLTFFKEKVKGRGYPLDFLILE